MKKSADLLIASIFGVVSLSYILWHNANQEVLHLPTCNGDVIELVLNGTQSQLLHCAGCYGLILSVMVLIGGGLWRLRAHLSKKAHDQSERLVSTTYG